VIRVRIFDSFGEFQVELLLSLFKDGAIELVKLLFNLLSPQLRRLGVKVPEYPHRPVPLPAHIICLISITPYRLVSALCLDVNNIGVSQISSCWMEHLRKHVLNLIRLPKLLPITVMRPQMQFPLHLPVLEPSMHIIAIHHCIHFNGHWSFWV
jgi:hypothetical protein